MRKVEAGSHVEVQGHLDAPHAEEAAEAAVSKHAGGDYVERGGSIRMFHVEGTTKGELQAIIHANVAREAVIMTDEGR